MNKLFDKLNIFTPEELLSYFEKNMYYGFTYRNKVFTDLQDDFQANMDKMYKIRLGEDFIKSKYGVCWDFCEFERQFFLARNIEHECFYIQSYMGEDIGGPTHTFALFKDGKNWCWFEYAWGMYKGIHNYSSKQEAFNDVIAKFTHLDFSDNLYDIEVFKTEAVEKRLNFIQFIDHCHDGKLLYSLKDKISLLK